MPLSAALMANSLESAGLFIDLTLSFTSANANEAEQTSAIAVSVAVRQRVMIALPFVVVTQLFAWTGRPWSRDWVRVTCRGNCSAAPPFPRVGVVEVTVLQSRCPRGGGRQKPEGPRWGV